MKQFLHVSPLRSRLLPFALALAAALGAAPARAAVQFNGGDPITIKAGETRAVTFSCDPVDVESAAGVAYAKSATVSVSPSTVVGLFSDPASASDRNNSGSSSTIYPLYETVGSTRLSLYDGVVYIRGLALGSATLTVDVPARGAASPATQDTVTVVVVEPDTIQFTRDGSDKNLIYAEGGTADSYLYFDFGYSLPSNVTFTVDASDTVNVSCGTTFAVGKGSSTAAFPFRALDGPASCQFTFTGTGSYYANGVSATVTITNVPPVLASPSTNPDNPTPVSALSGAPCEFVAIASDMSALDNTNLVYHWSIGGGTSSSVTNRVSTDQQIVTVFATDKTPGVQSETGYFIVTLVDSSRLIFTDACTLSSIVAGGGNGPADFVINPATTGTDDASNPWNEEAGNDFRSPGSTMVQALLPTNGVAYPFGWMFPDPALASSPSDLYIPNPNTKPIAVNVPDAGGVATIRYFSSNPYKDYYSELDGLNPHASIDDFGDFDQDGLSDTWEAWYLDGGKDSSVHTFDEWGTLAVTQARGLYGSSGTTWTGGSFYNEQDTPDNDRIPTSRYEELDNAWASDPHIVTNENAKNKVRAFLYPLVGNYVDYGTHIGDYGIDDGGGLLKGWATANGRVYDPMSSRRDPLAKPFFSNILEFRGLQQTSSAISRDLDKAPNWVAWAYPGILSRTNLEVRGNCPGTDPTVADTDGDGREDGWEYYFWTTILYENNPEYWRAYDPTLVLYPNLAPGGSTDFKGTGIPLLRDESIQMTLVTNGVSVRVADPATGTVTIEPVPLDQWDDYQAAHPGLEEGTDYRYDTEPADGSPILYDGGLYVRYPDQEFEVELVRSECFYGNPVLDPTTRSEGSVNYLTNYPVASTMYYDADQDPANEDPHPAVEFTIGNFHVYTRDGYVDAQGRAKLFFTPFEDDSYNKWLSDFWNVAWPTALEPGEIPGAYVEFRTGYFYLPGYDFYPPQIQALIGDRNAKAKCRYRTMNGLFPKAWILNQFDPNDYLAPNVADPDFNAILKPLGLSRAGWDPVGDLDGDGLSDYEEYYLGTNPIHWDTDNDGLPDGWEVLFGLDPHDQTDASGNPDCDRMFAVGPYRHADAFLYDYFNQTYWNGQQSLGFVPGAASASSLVTDLPFTSREEFYMQKWMMGKAGRNLIFLSCIYPSQWLDANGRCIYTTNPRNDDSNEDHIPDGWALYAGYIPVSGVDLIDHVWGPLHDFFPPICPDGLRNDPDGDGLVWRQEYDNWAMEAARGSQITNEVYLADEQDSYHLPSWYTPGARRWTNKLRPTSPWIADTDGDGLSDADEYMEGDYDYNGDGDALANFNPTTADTRFDRLPDSWHYLTGLYDVTNASGADVLGPFGPYGDPDGDGLPNYQEYLAGAVYAWRYDHWYSPDNKSLWQPDPNMAGYNGLRTPDIDEVLQLRRAQDARIAEKYSENPIVIGGNEARRMDPQWDPDIGPWDEEGNDPGKPFWEDAWPYGKSVHFQPYRASDFFRAAPSQQSVSAVVRTINVLETRWVNTITNIPKIVTGVDGATGNPIIGDGEPHIASGWDELYSPTLHDLDKTWDDPTFIVNPVANYIQRAWALLNDRKARCLPDVDPVTGELKDSAFISVDEYYILLAAIDTLQDYDYSYGARPAPWEPAPASDTIQYADADLPVVWRFMTPNFVGAAGFPTCMPRNPDSDNDGMDDYWEIYHGLNPLYGGSPSIGGAGSVPDSDRADKHPYGNGSTRDWIMNGNPTYVRVLTPTEIGLQPIKREDSAFHTPLSGLPIAEAAHFDYKTRPWLSGDRFADPDQDGLANQEESYNYLLNDVLHHTDPSPFWFTDTSYVESYANLYYAVDGELGSVYWWWDQKLLGSLGDGPSYLFDFEMGEGFDTDNDNISDREELTQGDNSGVTDPQDLDSPRNRKALYFDGHAAARTRNPYYHDKFTLTSFTVEFWVRPENLPAPGKRQTLVQRPVLMPVDDSSGATHWQIRHTFLLQIDELGQIHGRVDNDGLETVSSVTAVSAGRLVPGKWAHVALVMDSVDDRLTLYVNGEYAAGVGAGLKPCTGGLFGFQWLSPTGTEGTWENANLYDYSPAPIVLGAYDKNPWGVVGGPYETFPWGFKKSSTIAGQSQPEFDPDQYFTGWMDEVRIWDRCRSQSEIKNWMTKRVTKEDIEEVNRKRLAWELEGWEPDRVGVNLVAATAQSAFPQKLLYHYSFDNLPDTVANDRDTSFADYFGQDAWPYPAGWRSDAVAAYRPDPFWTAPWWYHYADTVLPNLVPWWYTSTHRSNVYSDYSYVPWIENTVAHMPQTPALDMKGLFPNWNEDTWTVASYRYRSTLDWENDAMIAPDFVPYRRDDVVPAALPAAGSTDVLLSQIRNTMNPYVMFYRTAVCAADETNPSAFAGKLDTYGRYTGIPILSDMLPLMDAVADMDVEMWDGRGRGTALEGVDTDGDGLPDWWEIAHGLDYTSGIGDDGAYGDGDGDGLDNWAEYLAHTDPFRYDTDGDGYSDYYSRPDSQSLTYGELYDDGDGMDNAWEIGNDLDPNRYDATDDLDGDGWTNWEEYMAGTNPNNSSSVPVPDFSVTFDYNGDVADTANLVVLSYGERTAGPNMGGAYDGKFSSVPNWSFPTRALGADGKAKIAENEWNVNYLEIGHVVSATMTISTLVNGTNVTSELPLSRWNEQYGMFLYDITGVIGMEYESGTVFCSDSYVDVPFQLNVTISGYTFPFTVSGLLRSSGMHLISGYNRFLGFIDVDGNGEFDIGEPMGLSTPRPTLVSWDAVETTVPLSDSIWDYPRLSWTATNAEDVTYFVDFSWVRGVKRGSGSETGGGSAFYAKTGDRDSDGLEDWMETLAGTDPASTNGVPNDYFSIDPATGLFYGELYDDGDGMPSAWELANGLDPQRYDATEDLDDDGWSNWAEFMAETDPTDADSFPEPALDVTFRYTGAVNGSSVLKVQSFGEFLHGRYPGANGTAAVNMAGSGDGLYTSSTKLVGTFGMPYYSDGVVHYYIVMAMGVTFDVSDTGAAGTRSATLSFYRDGELQTYELQEFNDEYGYFVDDDKDHIFFEYETGYMLSRSGEQLTEQDDLRGRWYTFEYTPAAKSYPFTVKNMTRVVENYHMVEGRNRFLGFMDLNSNGAWDEGEPMGISPEGATLVGWNSAAAEIPLSDSVWDYPRFDWTAEAAAAEPPADGAYTVTFTWDRGVSSQGGLASYAAITGDTDGDGLEDWMEALAGTDPASPNGVPDDYFSLDPATGLFWGELHDDGDGMPSAWEMRYGLDPYRFDAQLDKDDDGWSNWAEFMAGTDPANPDDFPEPSFDVVFRYTGTVDGVSSLKVLPYGASVHGLFPGNGTAGSAVVMGGSTDGIYVPINTTIGLWNDSGTVHALDTTWGSSYIGQKNITEATLYAYVDGVETSYTAVPFYDDKDYGMFVLDDVARIFIKWNEGLLLTQFFDQSSGGDSPIPSNISNPYSMPYRITFTTAGKEFPMTVANLSLDDSTVSGHMVEGPNRFLGLMDLNGNGTWDAGEPMGLSLGAPAPVGWETVSAEIPLTDSVWGYPRVAWEPTDEFDDPVYYVTFNWIRGGSTGEETEGGASYYGATGDWDNDGLEDWVELQVGTGTNSVAGEPNDYHRLSGGWRGFSYGELYDDGDGMPTAWEMRYGLDPYRYDASGDLDDDGWSNYAEFMAGTDPTVASSYPHPKLAATFRYNGEQTDLVSLGVYAYGQSTQGGTWGGSHDGRYTSTKGFSDAVYLGSDGTVYLDENSDVGASGTFGYNDLKHGLVESASVNVYVETADGATEVRTFQLQQINPGMGVFTQDDMGGIFMEIESGRVLVYGDYAGKTADVHMVVKTYTFPVTFTGLVRNPEGNHTHMVEGPNRFLGWMDLDGNETYDQGEPMGLALYNPTLVGWDSVMIEIPLTDTLWDYPRISWNETGTAVGSSTNGTAGAAASPGGVDEGEKTYYATFMWVRGASTRTDTETVGGGNLYYATTGDLDNDGLEDWMEALAGTDPASTNGLPNDYFSVDPATGFFYGELYDDGDGMPTAWEMRYGLDPYRHDATGDLDDDGWSNYAEFMGGTDPTGSSSYPHPKLAATFYYSGAQTDLTGLGVYTYGQKTQGATWGGAYDGRYTSTKGFSDGVYLGSDGTVTLDEYSDVGASGTFAVNQLRHGLIESASINVYVPGADGTMAVRQFQMQQLNPGTGMFTQDELGWILMELETGRVLSYGSYVGMQADVHTTVKTYTFPVTFTGLIRNPEGNHTHMVGGPNRFLGWMDLDGDDAYDQGEPMGLALYHPTLVDWDSTAVEIPLTDSLWDYPRISWNDFVPTNFVPTSYDVWFRSSGRRIAGSSSSNMVVVAFGDSDGDGLDAWMEERAGTNPALRDPDAAEERDDATGRLQYDWVDENGVLDANGKLTFGELLDDTDGMPAEWEIAYGLDPHLFDADSDLDDDGWSNYAEFLADTDPSDPDDYPEPQFDVTFRYDGEKNGASTLKVLAYSEKKQGTTLVGTPSETIYMGGLYDGLYTTQAKGFGNFADLGRGEVDGKDFGTSSFGGERIGSASLTVNYVANPEDGRSEKVTYQLQPYNDQFGVFLDDGEAFILLEYETGLVYSQFNYTAKQSRQEIQADGTATSVSEEVQKTNYESSPHYQSRYTIEYSSSTTHYPFTIRGLQAANAAEDTGAFAAHDHMVEGYNRFLGWMDLDNDNAWTPGEPMGLSLFDATLVGWNSAVTEIPLTDELFGFPRLAWPAATNDWVTRYQIQIWNGAGGYVLPDETGIVVEAPRTFMHEGDWIEAGMKGLDLGTKANDEYRYTVLAWNGAALKEKVAEGTFRQNAKNEDGTRLETAALYPTNNAVLHGPLVEFRWKMDWRTEGVFLTVKKGGKNGEAVIDRLYVPFPVRHNKVTDDDCYFSYVPQLADGRSIVSFDPGSYWWEVEENLCLANYTAKKASGTFKLQAAGATTRSVASISGNVHYYGRLADADGVFEAGKVVVLAYRVSDRVSSSLGVSGNPVAKIELDGAGPFEIKDLDPGVYGLVGFVDADGDGLPGVGETQGLAFRGGSADPVQLPEWFGPIRIAVADGAAVPVEDVHVVLRDRDLNGNKVPEIFSGSLADYKARDVVTVPAEKATNWVSTAAFDPAFEPYSTRKVKGGADAEEAARGGEWKVTVKAPRTFLHEGDLDLAGIHGFNLYAANAADFTWEVVATDGYHSETNSGDSFFVFAGTPDSRRAMEPRWPTQKTVVHGSTVRFEWLMEDRNAGVVFNLWKLSADGTERDRQLVTNQLVAFPVRHWDADVQCYYYTAVPQMEDGLRFLELEDGYYEYSFEERPNTTFLKPKSFTETFQLRNAENTRVTGSIEGTLRYYGRAMDAGNPPTWPADLHLQAYLVSEAASSSASVGGELVAEEVRDANGAFRIGGLKAGTYSVFAFVDANGNGVADEWETQGFGFFGGNASPVVVPAAAPAIIVTNGASVVDVNVVLHDRDTDGDLLPDGWEWTQYGSLSTQTGYDAAASNAYVSLTWSEGEAALADWTWKIDTSKVVTRVVDIPETDGLRVRIDSPRTFMHEGDLTVPYRLKDPAAPDEEGNRVYYLWELATDALTGIQTWQPRTEPYYGFYLGSYSNTVVSYSVESTDGIDTEEVAYGSFKVIGKVGSEREPLLPRYPVQMTPVQGAAVEFEWKMDEHNAGVLFTLKNLDTGETVVDKMVVPFPVRHWDAKTKCYYFTAVPQMEDGLRFLELPDGAYEYTITERPRTDLVEPQSFTERFRLRNAENTRTLGSIEGDVWYYGRSMEAGNPPTWPDGLHLQAYKVSDASTSSASVGGLLVAETVQNTNGAFRIGGLKAGTYSVFAFVDSNGNGVADEWETQGFGVYGGNASPVTVAASAPPIVVTNGASVVGVNVVLFDRDTDDDLLPDVWEWSTYTNLSLHNGWEPAVSNVYANLRLSEGDAVLTNWIWKIDTSTIVTRIVDIPETDGIRVRIDEPRTFLHEGDLLAPYELKDRTPSGADVPENRIYRLWKLATDDLTGAQTWEPMDKPYYGFQLGSYTNIAVTWTVEATDGVDVRTVGGSSFRVLAAPDADYAPAKARYPVQNAKVRSSVVEFEWLMDERSAGVDFKLWKTSGPEDDGGELVADMTVALPVRHWDADERCYYWTARPQQEDGLRFLDLEDGFYRYEIKTRPQTSTLIARPKTISERFQMAKGEPSRVTGSIEGTIRYFGRAMDAGTPPTWPAGLHLQARKVGTTSATSASVGGEIAADELRATNGAFRVSGLEAGTYTVFAFVDSNGNGLADAWETQGFGTFGGTASPVVVPGAAPPIVVTNGAAVKNVNVVLHDRDTDGDLLPDVWEWANFGSLEEHDGYETSTTVSNDYVSLRWSEGEPVLRDWSWPIDWSQVVRRAAATAVKEALKVRVEAPRTFLHEGDLLVPYVLRDRSAGAADEPANRLYRLWRGEGVDGAWSWIPQTEPVFGFDLGSHSNIVVSWTVDVSDGSGSTEIASGSFPVVAQIGEARMPAAPVYPVQNEKVRSSVVEFRWTMDDHNAGATFDLWKVDGPEGEPTDAGRVMAGRVVPIPVRHWDAANRCYYWTARPQQTAGTDLVQLEDGFYVYEITPRPQTDLVDAEAEKIRGRFQMAKGEASPTTASIEGTVRYFGRAMEAGTPPTWPADLHVQAWKVSAVASSSASAGGVVWSDEIRRTNGAFRVEGLPAGTYSIFAFVDSNGNGIADDWETQGFGVYGGNASPVLVAAAAYPIVVTNGASVTQVNVVLHDRDTDNDLLPDVWEWAAYTNLALHNGYEPAASNAYVSLRWSEGEPVLLDWSWKATNVLTHLEDNPETDALRVRVDGPRTFLHEGDFLTPWVYVNKKKGLVAEGVPEKTGNRDVYMWQKNAEGNWTPMDAPYYGFELGSYSNVVVNWTVSSWDGVESTKLEEGSFRIVAAVGNDRKPLLARYPTQLTEVHGNTVEFEWEMDDSNAGVLFDLWKIDGNDGQSYPVHVITNMVVAFPIRHGASGTDGCHWSAVPQLEDGLQEGAVWTPDIGKTFIPLPGDGVYQYSITERPQTSIPGLQETQTVTERFRLVNSGETRGLYDVSGDIRYYGRVMESDADALAGVAFQPNAARTVWTADADPSNLVAGAMSVLVADAGGAVEVFNDSAANGILYASGGTNTTAWSGTIDYGTGEIVVRFTSALAAGREPKLALKSFPAPLVLQAFKLADEAKTAVSVSGVPVYQEVRRAKGSFKIPNLAGGKYAIRAFVDSNGNGFADDWETQGVAVHTGTVSPNLDADAAPIVVNDDVTGLMIVLHDRDTDNDLLPDSWEWWKIGNLLTSGYDVSAAGGLLYWQEYADGALDSDPRTPDTDLDGLTDAMEILVTGTDTHLADTDGDGVGDLEEFLAGSDPNDPASKARYAVPALEFGDDGTPYVDVSYPALRPGVVLTYELQRKLSLADDVWETVDEYPVANNGGAVYYSRYDGVNDHLSEPGTERLWPHAEGVDYATGFFRVKVFADYGEMRDNGDGTWSYWTWLSDKNGTWTFREAARGEGTLVRDANGNWRFVDPETKKSSGTLYRDPDGDWKFVK